MQGVILFMKEMDFGIIYPNEQSEDFEGYIKYCGINKSCEFIFREECSDGKSNTIYISDRKSHTEITPEKNVVSQFESLFDGYRYYLIQKPNRLCVYSSDNLVKVVELDEYSKFTPLYICDTLCEIIGSGRTGMAGSRVKQGSHGFRGFLAGKTRHFDFTAEILVL